MAKLVEDFINSKNFTKVRIVGAGLDISKKWEIKLWVPQVGGIKYYL